MGLMVFSIFWHKMALSKKRKAFISKEAPDVGASSAVVEQV